MFLFLSVAGYTPFLELLLGLKDLIWLRLGCKISAQELIGELGLNINILIMHKYTVKTLFNFDGELYDCDSKEIYLCMARL